MQLPKISEADMNFGEDNVPVPSSRLNNSREYDAAGKNLLLQVYLSLSLDFSPERTMY